MSTIQKKDLTKLYDSGKSMFEISIILKCSVHKIVYWMNKYDMPRRTISEAVYVKLNPNGDPFRIKTNLNIQEMHLFGIGLGIYWGEGEKISTHAIRVANTDPRLY